MRLLIELTYGRCGCRTCRIDRLEWRWAIAQAVPGSFGIRFAPMPPICRHPDPVQACKSCGCWHYDACIDEDEEPCGWAAPDLCSACARHTPAPQPLITPMDDLAHPA